MRALKAPQVPYLSGRISGFSRFSMGSLTGLLVIISFSFLLTFPSILSP